ncbi:MAG: hypothetical protein GAK30_02030 [Paracidovorax wautersii]|uniref:DUF937 domain-containing protein n=1 Tax=Paracidovorax wautersii TaxID=1177982 RepID=A0A7V8FNS4_9BURK|nr:MAG: hypothetical protein GAK30_02030 [Paracidovorax wautersii]
MSLLDTVLSDGVAAVGRSATAESGLLPVLIDLLSAHGGIGGLSGLAEKFARADLSPIIQSWIANQSAKLPITGAQLQQVLGSELVQTLAARMGTDTAHLLPQLSQFLPVAVDRLTPEGRITEAGASGASELLGLFGNFLKT